jgi:hypothetical protein
MRLSTHIVKYDTGFAPNPFYRYCTLACCKPAIRRTADERDWIVGLTAGADEKRVVYAVKVARKLTFRQYWTDPVFVKKKPDMNSTDIKRQRGDNVYEPVGKGQVQTAPLYAHRAGEQEA